MNIRLLLSLLVLCCSVCTFAQHRRLSRAAVDSLQRMRQMKGSAGVLRFDRYRHDMGVMSETDSVRTVRYTFCNTGNSAVTIAKVSTTCGCAVASYNRMPVEPGDSGCVYVTFSPQGKGGTVDADAFVYTDTLSDIPAAHLVLTGEVLDGNEWDHLPVQIGHLRLKSSTLRFAVSGDRELYTERIVCANTGMEPVELKTALLPSFIALHTEPAPLKPGEEGDIVVTLDASGLKIADGETRRFRVLLDGVKARPSARTISVEVISAKKKYKIK